MDALDGTRLPIEWRSSSSHRLGTCWLVSAHYCDASDQEDLVEEPRSLIGLFRDGKLTHDLLINADDDHLIVNRRDIRKYKPLQALDALTNSQKLRDAVPLLVAPSRLVVGANKKKNHDNSPPLRRVRVTYTFDPPPDH